MREMEIIAEIMVMGSPAFKMSLLVTYPVPCAMAIVGSDIGNMKDKEQAMPAGIANELVGRFMLKASVVAIGSNMAASPTFDTTCVSDAPTTIKSSVIVMAESEAPTPAMIDAITQFAVPVAISTLPTDSADAKKTMVPQSTFFSACLQVRVPVRKNKTAPNKGTA